MLTPGPRANWTHAWGLAFFEIIQGNNIEICYCEVVNYIKVHFIENSQHNNHGEEFQDS